MKDRRYVKEDMKDEKDTNLTQIKLTLTFLSSNGYSLCCCNDTFIVRIGIVHFFILAKKKEDLYSFRVGNKHDMRHEDKHKA